MATIDPTDALRRSFIYRKLTAVGATFDNLGDGAVATNLPGVTVGGVEGMATCDLSGLPRIGFKGRDALDWLRGRDFDFGDTPNRSYRQPNGVRVAVLAPTEALLLSPLAEPALSLNDLAGACALDDGILRYPVLRGDANFEFLITGHDAAAMFAKVCGVDLRPSVFDIDAVAQTSVARSNAIVVRADIAALPAYRIFGDSASAEYMWDSLLDAMIEYDGVVAGLADILSV